MARKPRTQPSWDPGNLQHHYKKRNTENRGCLDDLLGTKGVALTLGQYEQLSLDVIQRSWGVVKAFKEDKRRWREYFVDYELMLVAVDCGKNEICTCLHEHFQRPGVKLPPEFPRGHCAVRVLPPGERREKFRRYMEIEERARYMTHQVWRKGA